MGDSKFTFVWLELHPSDKTNTWRKQVQNRKNLTLTGNHLRPTVKIFMMNENR